MDITSSGSCLTTGGQDGVPHRSSDKNGKGQIFRALSLCQSCVHKRSNGQEMLGLPPHLSVNRSGRMGSY